MFNLFGSVFFLCFAVPNFFFIPKLFFQYKWSKTWLPITFKHFKSHLDLQSAFNCLRSFFYNIITIVVPSIGWQKLMLTLKSLVLLRLASCLFYHITVALLMVFINNTKSNFLCITTICTWLLLIMLLSRQVLLLLTVKDISCG